MVLDPEKAESEGVLMLYPLGSFWFNWGNRTRALVEAKE